MHFNILEARFILSDYRRRYNDERPHSSLGYLKPTEAITDASGAVVARYEFDAWGAQLGSSSPSREGSATATWAVRTDATTRLLRSTDPGRRLKAMEHS
ncbi:MAG: hypothetical protein AMXMBFR33_08480 [Candidatus Xenobia bacterium]